jgi:hypothetical protein
MPLVRQAEMFLRRDVAEHCGAVSAVIAAPIALVMWVVPGREIGRQRPKRGERRFVAQAQLLIHVGLIRCIGTCPALRPSFARRASAQSLSARRECQLGHLRFVIGIVNAAGPQLIA